MHPVPHLSRLVRRRAPEGRPGDAGMTIVAVLGAFLLVSVLLLGTLTYLTASVRFSRLEQDSTAAEAAAQSGIHDFLTRLRLDGDYLDHADPASTDPDNYCQNPAAAGPDVLLPLDGAGQPACSNHTGRTPVGWVAVEAGAAASPDTPSFHYRVVRHDPVQREILLEAVGRSRDVYRTLQARIAHPSTSDYLYFSDYELADPQDDAAYPENTRYPGTQNTSRACGGGGADDPAVTWAWSSADIAREPRTYVPAGGSLIADCLEPRFTVGDVLAGRVHSNDTIRSTGAVFQGRLSTSDPRCASIDPHAASTWRNCLSDAHHDATFSTAPVYEAGTLTMPRITELSVVAESQGCRYSGATRIILHEDGTMTVWSKDSTAATTPSGCGLPGTGAGQLGSAEGATVPVPEDGLVYVADVAADAGTSRELYAGEIGGPSGRALPLGTYAGQVPVENASYQSDVSFGTALKHAGFGNLYLEGVAHGRVTFGADKSVVLTGDVVLAGGNHGDDVVGIVAGRGIEIFRPRLVTMTAISDAAGGFMWAPPSESAAVAGWPTRYADPTTGAVEPASGIQVSAALLALQGSVRVQQWSAPGLEGTLRIHGSVAQRFRGTVAHQAPSGQVRSGYVKRYEYDDRLDGVLRPPHFPALADGIWTVIWTEEHATDEAVKRS